MSGCAVLARTHRLSDAVGRRRLRHRPHPGEAGAAAQAEALQIGQGEPADRAGHVAQRVAAGIAVAGGIGRGPDSQAIEDDERGAPHQLR